MLRVSGILAYLFFFVLSWTDTFSVLGRIPLFMVFGFLLVVVSVKIRGRLRVSIFGPEDVVITALLVWVLLTALVHPNDKTLNYMLTYTFVFMVMYLGIKVVLYSSLTTRTVLRANFIGVYFVLVFVLVEFAANTFWGVDIQEYLPRRRETTASFMDVLNRSYGLSTEPGALAYYLSTMGLLALWYLFYVAAYARRIKVLMSTIFVAGYMTLYSATGVLALMSGLVVSGLLNIRPKAIRRRAARIGLAAVAVAVSIPLLVNVFSPMYEKVVNLTSNRSGHVRMERWAEAGEIIRDHPVFGLGLGAISAEGHGSPISWYLFLMSEAGILAGLLLFVFYALFFARLQGSSVKGKVLLSVSFLAGVVHLAVISTFQYPYVFVAMILIALILESSPRFEVAAVEKGARAQ